MNFSAIRGAPKHAQTRRAFLAQFVTAALIGALKPLDICAFDATPLFQPPLFQTDPAGLQAKYDAAIVLLR